MTTFSQLVDDVVIELLRPDMRTTLAAYVNQTVRELHFKPNADSPNLYDANREEAILTINTEPSWLWAIPSSTRFQAVESIYLDDPGVYIGQKNPKIALRPSFEPYADMYWYRSGPTIALFGVANGWTGKMSYFQFPQTLGYKAAGSRLVQYDVDTDSYKLIIGGGVPTDEQLAVETHWMLQRWGESVVKEGVRAKGYKRLGDEARARMCYSSFESLKSSVWNTEPTG